LLQWRDFNLHITFTEIYSLLPKRLEQLLTATKFPIKDLTEGKVKKIFGEDSSPIEGVFLVTSNNKSKPLFVGRSRNLAQRIGVDLRATNREQATLSYKLTLLKDRFPLLESIRDAREYMYNNFSVQMIRIDDENERAIFQIYAAMELETLEEFNSFRES
jgi:hypothetical protein